jgi:hypothetical protein
VLERNPRQPRPSQRPSRGSLGAALPDMQRRLSQAESSSPNFTPDVIPAQPIPSTGPQSPSGTSTKVKKSVFSSILDVFKPKQRPGTDAPNGLGRSEVSSELRRFIGRTLRLNKGSGHAQQPAAEGLKGDQLYNAPMSSPGDNDPDSSRQPKRPMIKFDSQDIVHSYTRPGVEGIPVHQHRAAVGSSIPMVYRHMPRPRSPLYTLSRQQQQSSGVSLDIEIVSVENLSEYTLGTNVAVRGKRNWLFIVQ